jgi:hypothetical protein
MLNSAPPALAFQLQVAAALLPPRAAPLVAFGLVRDGSCRLGLRAAPLRLAASGASPVFPTKLRGVLFDMDGTLSDSESLHFTAYKQVRT